MFYRVLDTHTQTHTHTHTHYLLLKWISKQTDLNLLCLSKSLDMHNETKEKNISSRLNKPYARLVKINLEYLFIFHTYLLEKFEGGSLLFIYFSSYCLMFSEAHHRKKPVGAILKSLSSSCYREGMPIHLICAQKEYCV